jgi:hypothetical protein
MNRSQLGIVLTGVVLLVAFGTAAATIVAPTSNLDALSSQPEDSSPGRNTTAGVFDYLASVAGSLTDTRLGDPSTGDSSEEPTMQSNATNGSAAGSGTPEPFGLALLVVLVGIVVIGSVLTVVQLMAMRRRDSDSTETPTDDGEAAASAAADDPDRPAAESMADLDLSNDVYCAWFEMLQRLDETDWGPWTPRECASAAIEAGMDREAVVQLTDQFERVRYGGASPMGECARRAVAARRRLGRGGDSTPGSSP